MNPWRHEATFANRLFNTIAELLHWDLISSYL